jgi:hypothetical protein
MRPFDRDLVRGGHYGQRSCEPHQQAEHMAAPTNAAFVKKVLANSEPSTHGPKQKCLSVGCLVVVGVKADIDFGRE